MHRDPGKMNAEVYVYYRIDLARRDAALAAADRVLRTMRNAHGVQARLLEKRGETALWMEVYAPVTDPDAFCSALEAAAQHDGLTELLAPGSFRHVDCFSPCA
jgi:hypothetical protein